MAEGMEGGWEGEEEGERVREVGGRECGRGRMPAALTTPRILGEESRTRGRTLIGIHAESNKGK